MTTVAHDVVDFLDVAPTELYRRDPYPHLARLRANAPVARTPTGTWVLSSYADVVRALRSHELHTSVVAADELARGAGSRDLRNMLLVPADQHARVRRLLGAAFFRQAVVALSGQVERTVGRLLDDVRADGDGEMDLVADVAYPLPSEVMGDLLGLPPSDRPTLHALSRVVGEAIDPDWMVTDVAREAAVRAGRELSVYFADLIAARRRRPGTDLLTAMVESEVDGDRLGDDELLANAVFLFVSGHESTVNLIGNGMLALLDHPDQATALQQGQVPVAEAVEEMLRYDSPLQMTVRVTASDYEVGGLTIPPGCTLVMLLGAANRDPVAFGRPDTLDLARRSRLRHVGFGGGGHFCLGAPLARLTAGTAVNALVRRFSGMEQAGPETRTRTFTLRGVTSLPVRYRKASR